jgi:hypothetical protein
MKYRGKSIKYKIGINQTNSPSFLCTPYLVLYTCFFLLTTSSSHRHFHNGPYPGLHSFGSYRGYPKPIRYQAIEIFNGKVCLGAGAGIFPILILGGNGSGTKLPCIGTCIRMRLAFEFHRAGFISIFDRKMRPC